MLLRSLTRASRRSRTGSRSCSGRPVEDRTCTWCNQRWLDFTGRTLADELGDGWMRRRPPRRPRPVPRGLPRRLRPRRSRSRSSTGCAAADGEYRWILDHGVPWRAKDGDVRRLRRAVRRRARDPDHARGVPAARAPAGDRRRSRAVRARGRRRAGAARHRGQAPRRRARRPADRGDAARATTAEWFEIKAGTGWDASCSARTR